MKKILSIVLMFIYSASFSQITLSETHQNVSCFGGSNGSASVTVSGGTGPYTFTWTPTNTNSAVITGIAAGQYTINVEDALANTSSLLVNISQPLPINISMSPTNTACGGICNGAATAMVTGGNPAYTFQWMPIGGNTNFAQNLCAGNYTFQATDGNNCVGTDVVIISNNGSASIPNATITTTLYNETCLQTGDGAIDLTITGTNPGPFTYQWSNSATTQDITNLTSNSYW